MIAAPLRQASLATLAGLAVHYAVCLFAGFPLLPEAISEWIMARTPAAWALAIMETFGPWAKPFAATGGLAALGFLASLIRLAPPHPLVLAPLTIAAALLSARLFEYQSLAGLVSHWLPFAATLFLLRRRLATPPLPARREFLRHTIALPAVMLGGTAAVAGVSYLRELGRDARAIPSRPLSPYAPPEETFAPGLVRRAVTPLEEFYVMSKNAVDPSLDPRTWQLRITSNGELVRLWRYTDLLALARHERYVTLRCVSNTLKSNLMGTALWSGVSVRQLCDVSWLPSSITELAIIGADGHDDSLPIDYALSSHVFLALGMNGLTLNRAHGFPVRFLAPRYYGFKSVKWISELAFVSTPYYGTWPKMGYTKEPVIHTMSYIDRVRALDGRLRIGGVAFAGARGIGAVELRADGGPWTPVALEQPLSSYTWTRWKGELLVPRAELVEARARDGEGIWQATEESPLFPDGVKGPTKRKLA